MAKYRSRLQIIAEILQVVRGGAKKTHVMYKANLSHTLLCRYLAQVLECGLVRVDGKDQYVVAPKGEKFLQRFNSYVEQRQDVAKALKRVDEERALLEQMYTNSKTSGAKRKALSTGKSLDIG